MSHVHAAGCVFGIGVSWHPKLSELALVHGKPRLQLLPSEGLPQVLPSAGLPPLHPLVHRPWPLQVLPSAGLPPLHPLVHRP